MSIAALRLDPESVEARHGLLATLTQNPLTATVTAAGDTVRAVAWSRDGSRLAAGSEDRSVSVWNMGDPARSRDGAHLASGADDGIVTLWDVRDPNRLTPRASLVGHTGPVDAVAWSPGSTHLATGGRDRLVIIWDLRDPAHPVEAAAPLTGHTNEVSALAWAPDGAYLASGGDDHTIVFWDSRRYTMATDAAIDAGCVLAGRGLTEQEWDRYVPGVAYRETCPR